MIDITKKYKTKHGYDVKLYDIIDDRVIGAVNLVVGVTNNWCAATWNLQGLSHNSNFDLVEVPKFSIDSFVQKKLLKEVAYFGKIIKIPFTSNFVWVNHEGKVCSSASKPQWNECYWSLAFYFSPIEVGRVNYTGNIKDSLIEV